MSQFFITSFVLLAILGTAASISCPTNTKPYGQKCYGPLGMTLSRNNALEYCRKTFGYYARLATPLTAAENGFLTEQVQVMAAWHTWLEFRTDGTYVIGDDGKPPSYTHFAVGEPFSVADGYCITIGLNGYWYAQPCDDSHSVICEVDLYPPTTTAKPIVTAPPSYGFPSCVQKYLNFVPCPSGWEYYPPTCSCFKILSNSTYYNAMNACRSIGGTLASVHTTGEAAFIYRLAASTNSYWYSTATERDNIIIGLTYNSDKKMFIWDDSTSFDFFQGFAPGEPANYNTQGQLILNSPTGYATYMRMGNCASQTCRYAACKRYVY